MQLVRVADYYISLMTTEGDTSLQASVGLIYRSRIHILSEAYSEYLDGLGRAKQFLHELASTERYASYIKVCT